MGPRLRRILAALTIPFAFAVATTAAVPALADTTGHLCEAYAPRYCAGGDLSSGSAVREEATGRTVTWHRTTGTYGGWPVGQLKEGSLCMRRDNLHPGGVILGDCGSSGTAWWDDTSGPHHLYGNRLGSQTLGYNVWLSGVGIIGQQLQIAERYHLDWSQTWTLN